DARFLAPHLRQTRNIMRNLFDMHDERSDSPDFDAADPDNWVLVEQWQQFMRDKLAEKTVAEWIEIFDEAGVPTSPFYLPEEVADIPHARETGMIVELEHPITGPQLHAGPLIEMSETPPTPARPSPATGEHTAEVLLECGFDTDEVAELFADGVVE
ncbi:MAG: CoA transferase, partial [Acidobacteria bacterium]|nr:CoA transferase [Acidobacteriota bacterium]